MAFFDQKHGLTPLEKRIFWTLKNSFSKSKRFLFPVEVSKHYFKSNFLEIYINKKKLAFFVQKQGLTPLEKCDFLDFEKFCFL